MAKRQVATFDPRRVAAGCPDLAALEAAVPGCTGCPRLVRYCAEVKATKVKRHASWDYWGRPVPGFGDPRARIFIVGLAPGAHGANRTGRLFTGDRSGDFLHAGLHRAGLASQPESTHLGDGLRLVSVYIGAAARCAPPGNRPEPSELARCQAYLCRELELLGELRVVLALGGLAHDAAVRALTAVGKPGTDERIGPFAHGAEHVLGPGELTLLDCYHVSQQNTFTGRLTPAMLDAVLGRAKKLAGL